MARPLSIMTGIVLVYRKRVYLQLRLPLLLKGCLRQQMAFDPLTRAACIPGREVLNDSGSDFVSDNEVPGGTDGINNPQPVLASNALGGA
jgi:hypothetical protein